MIEAFMVTGIWFIGISILMAGVWISAQLQTLENIKNELDNIWLELSYLDKNK